ncbi:MAG: hypothetical protein O2814_04845 [Bacteroidetes bacterium]|nr:hypothetical protein [Bacteroidota bacterium]
MSMKFKKGDKVICIDANFSYRRTKAVDDSNQSNLCIIEKLIVTQTASLPFIAPISNPIGKSSSINSFIVSLCLGELAKLSITDSEIKSSVAANRYLQP